MQRTAWSETAQISSSTTFEPSRQTSSRSTGMTQQDQILAPIAAEPAREIDLDELEVCRDPYIVEDVVMEKFRSGLTLGINQFEEPAAGHLSQEQPQSLVVDLAAINALYRPRSDGDQVVMNTLQNVVLWEGTVHPLLVDNYW